MKSFISLFLFFLAVLPQNSFAQSQLNVEKLVPFENFIKEEIKNLNIAGAEVLIYKNKEVAWHKAMGYVNLKTQKPLKKNSIYYIQSMTKPIISVALMQLVEKGLVGLEDKAEKYIPELAKLRVNIDLSKGIEGPTVERESDITIKQLLTHTAGFSHGLETTQFDQELFKLMYNDLFNPREYTKIEQRIDQLLKAPLIGQPGEQWKYSASPDLLALIIKRVSGQDVNSYLNEFIFEPLGMTETGYNVSASNTDRVMLVYLKNEAQELIPSPYQVPTQGNTVYGGTHGLFSSMEDFLTFCKMVLNNGSLNGKSVLKPETLALMKENHIGSMLGGARGFGLGFGVLVDTDNDPSPGSNGQIYWGGFFKTHFFIDPAEDMIAIFMTQKFPSNEEYVIALNRYVYSALE